MRSFRWSIASLALASSLWPVLACTPTSRELPQATEKPPPAPVVPSPEPEPSEPTVDSPTSSVDALGPVFGVGPGGSSWLPIPCSKPRRKPRRLRWGFGAGESSVVAALKAVGAYVVHDQDGAVTLEVSTRRLEEVTGARLSWEAWHSTAAGDECAWYLRDSVTGERRDDAGHDAVHEG